MATDWEANCKELQALWLKTKDKKVLDRLYKEVYSYLKAITVRRERGVEEYRLDEACTALATDLVIAIMNGKHFWVFGAYLAKRYKAYLYQKPKKFERQLSSGEDLTDGSLIDHHALVAYQKNIRDNYDPEGALRGAVMRELIESMTEQVNQTVMDKGRILSPLEREICRVYVLAMMNRWIDGESRAQIHARLRRSQLLQREWIKVMVNEAIYRIRTRLKEAIHA